MDKADHFLWIVQTMILANATQLASQPVRAKVYRDDISASGAFVAMDEAVRASQMIPNAMTAAEAANQFCTYILRNLREPEERAAGQKMSVPGWLCDNVTPTSAGLASFRPSEATTAEASEP